MPVGVCACMDDTQTSSLTPTSHQRTYVIHTQEKLAGSVISSLEEGELVDSFTLCTHAHTHTHTERERERVRTEMYEHTNRIGWLTRSID